MRAATPADTPEIIRLRRKMFASMGLDVGDTAWEPFAGRHLRRWLGGDALFGAVVEHPSGPGLVASGLVEVHDRIPSPFDPRGRRAYVSSICTDEEFRRRGLARAVLRHLLDGARPQGITVVDLHATSVGERLYVDLGFVRRPQPELRVLLEP